MFSGPDGWSQAEVSRAGLLGDFASKSFFVRLTGFQTTPGRNPNLNSCDRLPDLHQQNTMIRRQNDRSYSLSPDHRHVDRVVMFEFILQSDSLNVLPIADSRSGLPLAKPYMMSTRPNMAISPFVVQMCISWCYW